MVLLGTHEDINEKQCLLCVNQAAWRKSVTLIFLHRLDVVLLSLQYCYEKVITATKTFGDVFKLFTSFSILYVQQNSY